MAISPSTDSRGELLVTGKVWAISIGLPVRRSKPARKMMASLAERDDSFYRGHEVAHNSN